MSDPLARPSWRGRTNVDAMTIAALEYAERLAGHLFTVTQGSYQSSVEASAGTHDLGGAVDLRWTGDDSDIRALRRAGFAAWHRDPSQGDWPDHIHAVLIGHPNLAPSASRQVDAYYAGRNGLANSAADDGPRLNPIPVFTWPTEDDMADYAAQLDAIQQQNNTILKRLDDDAAIRARLKALVKQGRANARDLAELQAALDEKE